MAPPLRFWSCVAVVRTVCYNVGMAVVGGIHGIGQQFRGGYQLGDVWVQRHP
jgi:hypothetical protein